MEHNIGKNIKAISKILGRTFFALYVLGGTVLAVNTESFWPFAIGVILGAVCYWQGMFGYAMGELVVNTGAEKTDRRREAPLKDQEEHTGNLN